jgi:hypothetical protein
MMRVVKGPVEKKQRGSLETSNLPPARDDL